MTHARIGEDPVVGIFPYLNAAPNGALSMRTVENGRD